MKFSTFHASNALVGWPANLQYMEEKMEENQVQFLPFNAINEFMRDDFRLKVVRSVLGKLSALPTNFQDPINRMTRKVVQVPGFRNSEKAPTAVKLLPIASAFQKSPELVAAVLAAWAEIQSDLRLQIYTILKSRGWNMFPEEIQDVAVFASSLKMDVPGDWGVLPPTADRTRLPGFMIYWPAGQGYDDIYNDFTTQFPQAENSLDEVSLMAIWLSLRLPYKIDGEEAAPENSQTEEVNKN